MITVLFTRSLHLLLAGVALWNGALLAADKPPPGVIVAPVRLAEFADRIEALGTLRANESVDLTATVTETVSAIHFDDGDRVEKDQVLLEMTNRAARADARSARHYR